MTHEEQARAMQRYNYRPGVYDININGFRPGMEPSDTGDWVRFIDITAALQATERAVWEQIEQHLDEKADEYFQDVNTQARLAIEAVDTWCHAQAKGKP